MAVIPGNLPAYWQGEPVIAERLGSQSPHGANFSADGNSRATMTYIIDGYGVDAQSTNPLVRFCQEALGTVNINSANGALIRTPPMAHPQYRWLYADKISSIRGIGLLRQDQDDPSSALVAFQTQATNSFQLTAPYFGIYSKYEVTVEFGPRPYLALGDDAMNLLAQPFPEIYKITGNGAIYYNDNGQQVNVVGNPYRENIRYTTFTSETSAEYLTLKGGTYKFSSDFDGTNPTGSVNINNVEIPGFYGKTLIPKTTLKMTWFDVPYNFVNPIDAASTNIYSGLGRVNQNIFYGYAPGKLLYAGFSYTQKMKNQFTRDIDDYLNANILNSQNLNEILLADITFNFLFLPFNSYSKNGGPYPSSPKGVLNPNNLSYVNAGHNLAQANANLKYYPVVANDLTGAKAPPLSQRKKPPYLSYPFELMFNGKPYIMESTSPI